MQEIRKGGIGHNKVDLGVWVEGTPSGFRIARIPCIKFELRTEQPVADLHRWAKERRLEFSADSVMNVLTPRRKFGITVDVQIAGRDPQQIVEVIGLADEKYPKLRPIWTDARRQAAALSG